MVEIEKDREARYKTWRHPMPEFPKDFYNNLYSKKNLFKKVDKSIIDLETRGKAFLVKKGQTVRIVQLEQAQIVDFCIWNAKDPRERFWNDYTLCRETFFISKFSRLWSNMPRFRPLMTVLEDTVNTILTYPSSKHHYCFGSHCNPSFWYYALGRNPNHPFVTKWNCWCNLCRAIKPFGLTYRDLHDNINLFQKTHFNPDGSHPVEPSDAKKGDYVEFYAEIDVLVAASICPSGTGTYHWSEAEKDVVSPVGVEIYDTGVEPLVHEMPLNPEGFLCLDYDTLKRK